MQIVVSDDCSRLSKNGINRSWLDFTEDVDESFKPLNFSVDATLCLSHYLRQMGAYCRSSG